jgi:hypothetical protein
MRKKGAAFRALRPFDRAQDGQAQDEREEDCGLEAPPPPTAVPLPTASRQGGKEVDRPSPSPSRERAGRGAAVTLAGRECRSTGSTSVGGKSYRPLREGHKVEEVEDPLFFPVRSGRRGGWWLAAGGWREPGRRGAEGA